MCRYNWHSAGFLGWPFSMMKYKYIFEIKYTEAILSNKTRKLLWFEITKMLIALLKSKLIVSFVIISAHFRSLLCANMTTPINRKYIAYRVTSPPKDRVMATDNMHKKSVKIGLVVPDICSRKDKQTRSLQYSATVREGGVIIRGETIGLEETVHTSAA